MVERGIEATGIRVRLLTIDDVDIYRHARLAGLRESPAAFSESYEDESKKSAAEWASPLTVHGEPPESFTIGALAGDALVAFATFERDRRSKARHKGMIHAMYTVPAWRGRGVGRAIVERVLEMARALDGLEQIHLWALRSDTTPRGFYESIGFERQGAVVRGDLKIDGRYVDAEYMVCRIEPRS